MRRKVERISEGLSDRLAGWKSVDTILLMESVEKELYNPYFFLSLDVYYSGDIPSEEERQRLFSDSGAFESSSAVKKDRFFIEDLPVRIEYKNIDRINAILDRIEENLWVFRQTGTYMFYRLQEGKTLFARSEWLERTKQRLRDLPDSFWKMLAASSTSTMEHYLMDMKAADMENDAFFYYISSAGFIKSMVSSLFITNKQFEPSGRRITEQLLELSILPENFRGRYESLLSEDPEFSRTQKCEIGELMVKSLFRLL